MTKRNAAKSKICRRLGVNLWGRAKDPLARRAYGPGQHGAKRKKVTPYGVQLAQKQKIREYYGNITEKQFRNIYEDASSMRGDTAENLIGLLERRLDAVVYRMKFVSTPFAARQFVNHGHVTVNGRRVTIPSYRVRPGDVIELSAKAKDFPFVEEALNLAERDIPEYVQVDTKAKRGTFVRTPLIADVPYPVEMKPAEVIEFYSR
ncbi:MAG TPA: 30S ribosomal protein S4 [Geminicoccus sp.]|uniref:30S ribosomal protein S4 n=1 Tax=Geminicoccus TaxID=489140 RepID=UPI001356DE1D|nr:MULTISPECIES: 30S ribosomal protein S4 [Geminicoccus]HWL68596.1 30S ribosomal protein S4 [Geminicoccus sp.]